MTIEVLDQYVNAVGGTLEVNVVKGKSKIALDRQTLQEGGQAFTRSDQASGISLKIPF